MNNSGLPNILSLLKKEPSSTANRMSGLPNISDISNSKKDNVVAPSLKKRETHSVQTGNRKKVMFGDSDDEGGGGEEEGKDEKEM